ncbi:Phosphatidylinositol N-acetylglucosaminyltransferase subunit Q [Pseudolycoriella hygida]|uniref:Phosphatidylinositol N-acetylglucosaminyltransferase subunit Q n=1 Tax=Pseudolycoriella hygida TaxID=35572 RepID=A0A9Q0S470_9DIPT|nr:Phosphatidylinositol N-acetylglucosaminyltransferase subunit Q [Pseudolycoriella hygida]
MVNVKIFISSDLYFGQASGYLFGYVTQIKESFTFYLLRHCPNEKDSVSGGQLFGEICDISDCNDGDHTKNVTNFVRFVKGTKNLLLNQVIVNRNESVSIETVQIILYDHIKWLEASTDCDSVDMKSEDCIKCLSSFICEEFHKVTSDKERGSRWNGNHLQVVAFILVPLLNMIKKLAVVKHMMDWYHCLNSELPKKQKLCTIAADVLAGLVILTWLIYLGKPGQYFMQFTEIVVDNVRLLLNSLKGSPVGLKLNVELNNFLLKCFSYHVDLWATFLVIVSPAVQYLFIPLAIIGCLGLSFQLALLSDLLIFISVHAHCFYVYAAVLYHIEVVGISALWRVFLGKRNNVLKNRIESHDYTNPQLYLATMFFATLLFILPTVLVYYTVFASLRFCVYCITYTLANIRRRILVFPTYNYFKWLMGKFVNGDNIEMSLVTNMIAKTDNVEYPVSVISIEPKASLPTSRHPLQIELYSDLEMPVDQFLLSLIRSDMLGFIHPQKKRFKPN